MVVCSADNGLQADIVFVIEGTAVNGAYINDLKPNYIIPSLEYFSQGNLDEVNYMSESANSLYGIVVYQAADCLPNPSSDTIGPFTSPGKLLSALEKLELIGGKGESHANINEGLATALQCFEELQLKRDANGTNIIQKHCILVCNSPPYLLPVMESQAFSGKTLEQLAAILQERGINLSVISPRKIPSLYKLFEKAGGDLSASQTKNYAKDPRHLVLLKGYSLKERPISPPISSTQLQNAPITSMPSPLPINNQTMNEQTPIIPTPPQGIANMGGGLPRGGGVNMLPNQMQLGAGYHAPPPGMGNRMPNRGWLVPPQPLPQQQQQQQQRMQFMGGPGPQQQGSALIAQLTQPPSSMPNNVNQFGQMTNNTAMNAQTRMSLLAQQQQQQQQNLQAGMGGPGQQGGGMQQQGPNQIQQQSPGNQQQQQLAGQSPQQQQQQQQMNPGRQTIWSGLLEWIEKPKVASDPQKITKHVPCSVSANAKDGEPELKADGWPSKLIMQLMPKQLIGNIGGAYLKNSKSVLFHPTSCEALESLTKVMSSGFAGCVHFTSIPNPSACDIKVLILLYTAEKRAYLGFIPNDQAAFVDRLRKVIQQQKSTQMMRQNPALPGGAGPMLSGPNQMPPTSQTTPPQGLMISQTNTMAMGGGQITQNVVTSSQQQQGVGGAGPILGQGGGGGGVGGPGGPMGQQRIRMPGMQQQQQQQQPPNQMQQQQQAQGGAGPNQMAGVGGAPQGGDANSGGGGGGAPFANQLEVERRANLDKINKLRLTLEAAQQQEQQYKNQLERISHMKTSQLQEALQLAQQQEMQYKMLDQQRLATQGPPPQAPLAQQQRMMRPVMPNNPGLRTLLQQQPQYRQQLMGLHQLGGGGGGGSGAPRGPQMQNAPNNQQVFDDVSNFDFM